MELTNVSAELKTATAHLTTSKKEHQNTTAELEETKTKMDEQIKKDQVEKEKKDQVISKLRALAKKYKGNNVLLIFCLNFNSHIYLSLFAVRACSHLSMTIPMYCST